MGNIKQSQVIKKFAFVLITIWGNALLAHHKLDGVPPPQKWDAKTIITGGIHHAVYALATGLVYDAIDEEEGW